MKLDDYQIRATRTMNRDVNDLAVFALGLAGEAGEVADLIKKHIGHGHDLDLRKVREELGDVLWYVAGLAQVLGLTLSEIAHENINKLERRYPEGFSHEASRNRSE